MQLLWAFNGLHSCSSAACVKKLQVRKMHVNVRAGEQLLFCVFSAGFGTSQIVQLNQKSASQKNNFRF